MRRAVISRLQAAVVTHGLDALVAASPDNVTYSLGFAIPSQSLAIRNRLFLFIVGRSGATALIAAAPEVTFVQMQDRDLRTIPYDEFSDDPMLVLVQVLREIGVEERCVGIETDFLPGVYFDRLRMLMPEVVFVSAASIYAALRAVKTPEEVEAGSPLFLDMVEDARGLVEMAAQRGVRIVLPVDVVVAKEVTRGAEHKEVPVERVPNSWSIVDVGPRSVGLFEEALDEARTILWNGPLGVFEIPTFGDGTRAMARYLATRAEAGATVVLGGGDSAAAVDQLGLAGRMTHVSTGGGATLEFLEGKDLPGIAILRDREAVAAT